MIHVLFCWLVKKWFYYKGIRFYESSGLPSNAESVRTHFKGATRATNEAVDVTFDFFREIFRDKVFRRGKFVVEEYHVFIIKATFDGKVDERFLKFNNKRLLCKNGFFPHIPNEVVADVLQGLYIAYIRDQS